MNPRATAAVVAITAAAVWSAYYWYRSLPLRDLPDVDLSTAEPAVQKAILTARTAVLDSPRSGAAWGELGQFLEAHTFHQEAQRCLAQAMRLDPKKFLWPYLRGDILNTSDPREAERCFRLAATLRPRLALPRLRLAEMFLEQRRLDDAAREYEAAIRIEPESARAMFGLGQVAYSRGDLPEARHWAEQSFELDREHRRIPELLSRVAYRLGDKPAIERLQAVLDAMPAREIDWVDPYTTEVNLKRRDLRAVAASATELLESGRITEAISAYERLVAAEPENPLWYSLLSTTLVRNRDFARAAEVIDAGLVRHAESDELHFNRGLVHFFMEQWAQAAREFRRAIELKPDFSDARYNLGQALAKLGDRDGAIVAFREAIRDRPGDAASYVSLGKLLLEAGDRDAAREMLGTAARLAPQDAVIERLLKTLRNDEAP